MQRVQEKGFTLIELLVVSLILSVLVVVIASALNVPKQLNRAENARRSSELSKLQAALDTYYNDYHAYPTTLPFGSLWQVNNHVYMQEVPQDKGKPYLYQTDGTTRPQWAVIYASYSSASSASCPLVNIASTCVPTDFASSSYNACIIFGNVSCAYISSQSLPTP
jgi:prepilin-type N-terminal cleavage/methylation domain-containing protein